MIEKHLNGFRNAGVRMQCVQTSAHNLVHALVERGEIAGIFSSTAYKGAQCLEQITVRYDTHEFFAVVDHEQMMKIQTVKNAFDDIKAVIHLDRDNSRRHDAAHIHGIGLYAWKTQPPS